MGQETTTRRHRPIVMTAQAGTTIYIGEEIQIEIRQAHRGRAHLHVYAPTGMDVEREVNFVPDRAPKNSDGPSVGAPEPSAK